MAAEGTSSAKDYIQGHLANWSFDLTSGEFGHAQTGFWVLHLDTLLFSWILGFGGLFVLSRIARAAVVGVPSRTQSVVEAAFGYVQNQVKGLFPSAGPLIAPMALTIFVWVFLMNSMDLVPVDLLAVFGIHAKLVPTTDLNQTLAMALVVFFLIIFYNWKVKGFGGFLREIASAPFGIRALPANVLLRLIEEFAKPLSLSMRLFGNLFAAEMIFLLIALLPFWAQWVFGGPWAIYHILVVPLQAYIFAVLTVVYLAQAHETH